MKELRIEVASEDEAREYCNESGATYIKVYKGRGINQGKLMLLASYTEQIEIPPNEIADWAVVTKADTNSPMYVSKYRGVTFSESGALLLTKEKAMAKAKAMTARGAYNWKAIHIRIPKKRGK